MVTCEINYFSLRQWPTEVILFPRVETLWKLAWNYFKVISEVYCSSWIFCNMFSVGEI